MKSSFIKSIILLLMCGVLGAVTGVDVMSVNEGDSVHLHMDHLDIQTVTLLVWRFGERDSRTAIVIFAENKITYKDLSDGRFKDKLQLDRRTGNLTISNIRNKHSGRYEVDINSGMEKKTFRVNVNESLALGADLIDPKMVLKSAGESVTLHTNVTELQRGDLILWGFGNESVVIAKLDKDDNKPLIHDDVLDGRFSDRLKLDHQTGSLTITNIRITDSGLYQLKISSNSKPTLYKTFSVSVSGVRDTSLSPGAIAGIFIGVIGVIAAVGLVLYRYRIKQQNQIENDSRKDRKKRKSESDCEIEEENNLKSAEN